MGGQAWVIAHKGGAETAAPGSLAAFDDALALDCDGIELDVRRLGDGNLVVAHDERFAGERLASMSLERLRDGIGRPPLLEEILLLVGSEQICNIEIKEPGYESDIAEFAHRYVAPRQLIFSSFLDDVVIAIRRSFPDAVTGLLIDKPSDSQSLGGSQKQRIQQCRADYLCVRESLIADGALTLAADLEMPALVWTVNDEQQMAKLLCDERVAGIITDYPRRAIAIRDRLPDAAQM